MESGVFEHLGLTCSEFVLPMVEEMLDDPSDPQTPIQQVLDLPGRETIDTTQQFFKWFSDIELDMEKGQDNIYRAYLGINPNAILTIKESVIYYRDTCLEILANINHSASMLDHLLINYKFVESKSKSLQLACESLLNDQNNLTDISYQLSSKLAYFNQLDPITKLLSTPGDLVCLDNQFIPMLSTLDHCLAFVNDHVYYRDNDLYTMRFRQCMTRALTLVKLHFCSLMRSLAIDTKEKLKDKPPQDILNASLYTSLFYVKFKTQGSILKPLISEIESRCDGHQEYYSLLSDCCNAYFNCRKQILFPQIEANMINLVTETDLITFLQKGCAYMITVCRDEFTLFGQFFDIQDDLRPFLQDLSSSLYDAIRPSILREVKIELLTEICNQLEMLMKMNIPITENTTINNDDTKTAANEEDSRYLEGVSIAAEMVVEKILEDAHQRLVFRAQAYIKSDIEGFKPRDEEIVLFARTSKLPQPIPILSTVSMNPVLGDVTEGLHASPAVVAALNEGEYDDGAFLNLREDLRLEANLNSQQKKGSLKVNTTHPKEIEMEVRSVYGAGEWYPTLQRTLFILGKLYNCVPAKVFEGISQEAVEVCRNSLVNASVVIAAKQTKLDGQLFLIKNLLMFREQISRFDISFVRKEESLDLSGFQDVISSLVGNKWSFSSLGRTFMAAATPKVVQKYSDSKQAVDSDLKAVCEDLILETVKASLEPISSFLIKVSAFKLRVDFKEALLKQPFAQNSAVLQTVDQFKQALEKRFFNAALKMSSYLGDRKTEAVLVKVIKSHILDTYQTFFDVVSTNYDYSLMNKVMGASQVADAIDRVLKDIK